MIKIKKALGTMQTWGITCKTGTKAWQQNVEWAEIKSKRWLWYQCEGLLGKTVELEIKVTCYILSYGRYREKRRKWFLHSETGTSLDCLPDFWLEHLMSHSLFLEAMYSGLWHAVHSPLLRIRAHISSGSECNDWQLAASAPRLKKAILFMVMFPSWKQPDPMTGGCRGTRPRPLTPIRGNSAGSS